MVSCFLTLLKAQLGVENKAFLKFDNQIRANLRPEELALALKDQAKRDAFGLERVASMRDERWLKSLLVLSYLEFDMRAILPEAS